MLSILVPIYNYNAFPLVFELHQQCVNCRIPFEILCQDDCSTITFIENNQINKLQGGQYLSNKKNLGRASNINTLAEISKFDYLLILEADSFPLNKNYIKTYIEASKQEPQAVFGGVTYSEAKPQKNKLLRWIYGNAREGKDLTYRITNPHDIVFSWNLLIEKKLFLNNRFDATITTYGFEDLVFLKKLKEKNVSIRQIDNPCVHQNEEQSAVFIEKSKIAVLNLIELYRKNILSTSDSSLLKAFEILKNTYLVATTSFLFDRFEKPMKKNLLSKKPSLFLFDLYRLGYFCKNSEMKNIR